MVPASDEPRASLICNPEDQGSRLDSFLRRQLPHLSRRAVRELIASGKVLVDGRPAPKGVRLTGGERIDVPSRIAHSQHLAPNPDLAVPILYEDPYLVAVDKPSGISSVALRPYERFTVANFLLARYPEMGDLSPLGLEAGLVHRLDRNTSGVLLAARTRFVRDFLAAEFGHGRVSKGYWALVHGRVPRGGVVDLPLQHDPADRRKIRIAPTGSAGRVARTRYDPLQWFGDAYTLLWVEITTGVMHQIRAHLASIGHPILGDALYGGQPLSLRRHFLHAARISFTHPHLLSPLTVEAPLPTELRTFLRSLHSPD